MTLFWYSWLAGWIAAFFWHLVELIADGLEFDFDESCKRFKTYGMFHVLMLPYVVALILLPGEPSSWLLPLGVVASGASMVMVFYIAEKVYWAWFYEWIHGKETQFSRYFREKKKPIGKKGKSDETI